MYKQNKDVIFRQEEDEAILFNPDNSDIVVINSTGCLIWSMCDGRNAKEEILGKIIDEFNVTAEKAEQDLGQFFSDLENKNFLNKVP